MTKRGIYGRNRTIYHIYINLKKKLYRIFFQLFGYRHTYQRLKAKILVDFRDKLIYDMQYSRSICNAGIINQHSGFLSLVKNQNMRCGDYLDTKKEFKNLYWVDFNTNWDVLKVSSFKASINHRLISNEQGLEDARLFRFQDKIWLYATLSGHTKKSWPCFGKLDRKNTQLFQPTFNATPPQKNWMPFELKGQLFLEYSINPHVILKYDIPSNTCMEVGHSSFLSCPTDIIMHGAAPALRYNNSHFLGVANTQEYFWYQARYYAAIFYLFEANPPYKITHMSKPLRFNSTKERIQYVVGMILFIEQDSLLISMGINDQDNKIIQISLTDIKNELKLLKA